MTRSRHDQGVLFIAGAARRRQLPLPHFGYPAFDGVYYLTRVIPVSLFIATDAQAFWGLTPALHDSHGRIHDVLITLDQAMVTLLLVASMGMQLVDRKVALQSGSRKDSIH